LTGYDGGYNLSIKRLIFDAKFINESKSGVIKLFIAFNQIQPLLVGVLIWFRVNEFLKPRAKPLEPLQKRL
jgi:hypothetical protein